MYQSYVWWSDRNTTSSKMVTVSVRELHNGLVSDPKYGGLKDARDEDDNTIISYSTLRSLLPPQL